LCQAISADRGRRFEGECPLLLWKIGSQLSPIFGENISEIFSDFGRK